MSNPRCRLRTLAMVFLILVVAPVVAALALCYWTGGFEHHETVDVDTTRR